MKIGFGAPIAGAWATPGYLSAFAERAEDAGYASLWTFQRLLVPEGSGMEPVYHSVLDPMVALGYVAARTSRIRLGVAIINLPFVSPAYLAKQATTVDVLSGGRFDLGLGIGWMPEEFAATGASMPPPGPGASPPSRCRNQDRRCCSAACPHRPWSGPDGWRTAGSPPAAPTRPKFARRAGGSKREGWRAGGV